MQKTCTTCGLEFAVTEEDLKYYDRIAPTFGRKKHAIPSPTMCPDCRHQRRMAFRNERNLYRRICDHTGKQFLSIYEENTPFPVYSYDAWWSDEWDAMTYGKMYDPSRSFFEQFQELWNTVPRLGIVIGHNENCDFCNYTNYSKDSYLCFGCHNVEQSFHNWRVHWSQSCVDCLQMDRSTLCYECIDCESCYNLTFSQDCDSCTDSSFLYDCRGCKNCTGCVGLRTKQYCLFNEQLSKEDYEKQLSSLKLVSTTGLEAMRTRFEVFRHTKPHRNLFISNSENVHGDHIMDSRNLYECYHVKEAEDCRYLESCEKIKDSVDNTFSGWPAELVFETMSAGVNCYNFLFCTTCWSCSNLIYCDSCHHSSDLFGCIGLRKKNQYCILNTQYTKSEYERLCGQIISDMEARGEWGVFFPASLTPHAYSETAAQEFYPLTSIEAEKRGYRWKEMVDMPHAVSRTIPAAQLPNTIDAVPDDILNWAIECAVTRRPFKIVKQELDFYRQMQLPIPHVHPDERHRQRMACRNPRKLWTRNCMKCGKEMKTTFSPERPEIVYCEECYLKEVY